MKAGEIDEYEQLLSDAEDQAESEWEMDFVSDMMSKHEQYGDGTFVSDAQLSKLEKIAGYK